MKRKIENPIKSDADFAIQPAMTPEAMENHMIALATNLAEQQLREGTASAQVITHYLKLATVKEKLELKKLEHEIAMMDAKTDALRSAENIERMYADAMEAFKRYSGNWRESDADQNI